MLDFTGHRVLVLGLGESGLAIARWVAGRGADLRVADTRAAPPMLDALRAELPAAEFAGGGFVPALLDAVTLLALSPGLSPTHSEAAPLVSEAHARGLPVVGEIELFARALAELRVDRDYRPRVVGVTGTNGKTTTTRLAGLLIERAGGRGQGGVAVAGNISPTALDTLRERLAADDLPAVWVLELSSFQLATTESLACDAAAVLNITQDHLDWHGTMDAYVAAKARIFGADTVRVLNRDDPLVIALQPTPPAPPKATRAARGGRAKALRAGSTALRAAVAPPVVGGPAAATPAPFWPFPPPRDGASAAAGAASAAHGEPAVGAATVDDGPPVIERIAATERAVRERASSAKAPPHPLTFGAGAPAQADDYGFVRDGGLTWLAYAEDLGTGPRRRKAVAELPGTEGQVHVHRLMPIDALQVRGRHNALNALAALALARSIGCPLAPMLHALRDYRGEPHRVQTVATIDGVDFVDDSKGTNVGATVAALDGLGAEGRRLVVILGGDGKGQDFAPLAGPLAAHARAVLLIGRDADTIAAALAPAPYPIEPAATLPLAVERATAIAQAGDAVLLSPACASLDMFRNYKHRAEVFVDAVREIAAAKGMVL